jgi:hypothetical protein
MQIRSDTALAHLLFYWPLILSAIATLSFFTQLAASRLFLLFCAGVLISYGVSMFLMMAVTSIAMATFAMVMGHHMPDEYMLIFYMFGSFVLSGLFLWWLGKSLIPRVE